jgi:hypothetical protein
VLSYAVRVLGHHASELVGDGGSVMEDPEGTARVLDLPWPKQRNKTQFIHLSPNECK